MVQMQVASLHAQKYVYGDSIRAMHALLVAQIAAIIAAAPSHRVPDERHESFAFFRA